MEKRIYNVVHEHRHGVSTYTVRCGHFPTEEELIEYCDIDYEPHRGEVITIAEATDDEVIDIP